MALITESFLRGILNKQGYATNSSQREFASRSLANEAIQARRVIKSYDIFLSHSYEDAALVKAFRDLLELSNCTVYVDWIEDPQMDRGRVTSETAATLKERMKQCRSLLYLTSEASRKSVWMPWELGFMDALTRMRVAIAPIAPGDRKLTDFNGQEYLGIYPYLSFTDGTLYIHASANRFVRFSEWLKEAKQP